MDTGSSSSGMAGLSMIEAGDTVEILRLEMFASEHGVPRSEKLAVFGSISSRVKIRGTKS
jgi:hypothetical protein